MAQWMGEEVKDGWRTVARFRSKSGKIDPETGQVQIYHVKQRGREVGCDCPGYIYFYRRNPKHLPRDCDHLRRVRAKQGQGLPQVRPAFQKPARPVGGRVLDLRRVR